MSSGNLSSCCVHGVRARDYQNSNAWLLLKLMTSVIQLAAHGKAEQVWRDMRVRSLWSPYYFVKTVLGRNKLSATFHLPEMERFVTNWANGQTKQAIEWSRAFYKTTCYTQGTAIWVVLPVTDEDTAYAVEELGIDEAAWLHRMRLHDQDATQLLAFETEDNAKKKVGWIKEQFEENQIFRKCFPEIAYTGSERPWNNLCLKIRRNGARKFDQEGSFEAIGVGGALQSRHYSIVWEDDLVGEKAIKSPSIMEDTIGWHGRLAGAFENATTQTRFLVSNRWGYADLNSYIRANEPDFVFHTRSAIETGEDGIEVAAFPEQFSLEKVCALRDGGSLKKYDFSCQYLNRPTLPGEKEVNAGALHYYHVEDDGKIVCDTCLNVHRLSGQPDMTFKAFWYASWLNRYAHYDPYNAKGAGSTSCPALVVVGTAPDGHVLLLDYWMGKQNYGGVYDRIFRYNDVWRPRMFTYEDVGHQNLTQYHIAEIAKTAEFKLKHKPFPRMEGIPTGNRTKEIRIREGLFPVIEKKQFAIRTKHQTFLSMLETFPHRQLDHDYDLLDALSQGSKLWRFPEQEEHVDKRLAEEDEYLRNFNKPYGVAGELAAR